MWRLVLLALALAAGAGCAADGPFADAWKDLRGDNMQMHSDTSRYFKDLEQPSKPKP